jgi:hypothetical protein
MRQIFKEQLEVVMDQLLTGAQEIDRWKAAAGAGKAANSNAKPPQQSGADGTAAMGEGDGSGGPG